MARGGGILHRELWGCVEEWSLRTVPHFAREVLRDRDHELCAGCGLDCSSLRRRPGEKFDEHRLRVPRMFVGAGGHVWEADHIVPLHRGGGGGLANLQTLCVPCHREKSAREARVRAA